MEGYAVACCVVLACCMFVSLASHAFPLNRMGRPGLADHVICPGFGSQFATCPKVPERSETAGFDSAPSE
jgi:hypothetical protein